MIKKIVVSFFFGLLLLIIFVPRDPWVQQKLGNFFLDAMQDALGCSITGQVVDINLLVPSITFKYFNVEPRDSNDQTWSWKCKTYTTSCSWPYVLQSGVINMSVDIAGLETYSEIQSGQACITPHIQMLLSEPQLDLYLLIQSLSFSDAHCTFEDKEAQIKCDFSWLSDSRNTGNSIKSRIFIKDGSFMHDNRLVICNISGTIDARMQDLVYGGGVYIKPDIRLTLPHLINDTICFVSGAWEKDNGRFAIRNMYNLLSIDPIILSRRKDDWYLNIRGSCPVAYVWNLIRNETKRESNIAGSILCRLQGNIHQIMDGYLALEDVSVFGKNAHATLSCFRQNGWWNGYFNGVVSGYTQVDGLFSFDENKDEFQASYSNTVLSNIPYCSDWQIEPHKLSCDISKQNGQWDISFGCTAQNTLYEDSFEMTGGLTCQDETITLKSALGNKELEVIGYTYQYPYVNRFAFREKNKTSLVDIEHDDTTDRFNTQVEFAFLQTLLQRTLGTTLQGEGLVRVESRWHNGQLFSRLSLQDANVRLPKTYNFINGFQADMLWDIMDHTCIVRNISCSAHQGNIFIPRLVMKFDQDFNLDFLHCPLYLHDCLLNSNKDLFATLSGQLLVHKDSNKSTISGKLFIERAQLKENIFSDTFQKQIFQSLPNRFFTMPGSHMSCNVSIETKDPIRIDTIFLRANATVSLGITNTLTDPSVAGSISLLSGTLRFPYKPLTITKGCVRFVPDQLYNPVIELVAQNSIQKYHIMLNVSGTLQEHNVLLDARPVLTDEQILTLLFTGSPEESLNVMMPALITQNLKHLLFGSGQLSGLQTYFKPFGKPFNIHLIPRFSDQKARGGLRGAIEINVNDRWRALIQKNFSLTEDTRFELEYLLTDDITLRAIRDERSDIGGEVEMRWKF